MAATAEQDLKCPSDIAEAAIGSSDTSRCCSSTLLVHSSPYPDCRSVCRHDTYSPGQAHARHIGLPALQLSPL